MPGRRRRLVELDAAAVQDLAAGRQWLLEATVGDQPVTIAVAGQPVGLPGGLADLVGRPPRYRRRMYPDEATFRAAYGAACGRLVAQDTVLTARAVGAAMEPWCSARTLERRLAEWGLPAPAQMEVRIRAERRGQRGSDPPR